MLRLMSGEPRKDRIRNKYVRDSTGIVSVVNKMKENRLRWSGHMTRRNKTSKSREVMKMNVEGKRGRGRLKK